MKEGEESDPRTLYLTPVRGPVENERMGDEGREREGGKEGGAQCDQNL